MKVLKITHDDVPNKAVYMAEAEVMRMTAGNAEEDVKQLDKLPFHAQWVEISDDEWNVHVVMGLALDEATIKALEKA